MYFTISGLFISSDFEIGDLVGRALKSTIPDQEVRIVAELPGLEEKDVQVEFANGVLTIKGEKRAENKDKDRLFSERYYGRFERRIPIDDVAEDKITAAFKNGLLTVTLPKSVKAQQKVKRISINPK